MLGLVLAIEGLLGQHAGTDNIDGELCLPLLHMLGKLQCLPFQRMLGLSVSSCHAAQPSWLHGPLGLCQCFLGPVLLLRSGVLGPVPFYLAAGHTTASNVVDQGLF